MQDCCRLVDRTSTLHERAIHVCSARCECAASAIRQTMEAPPRWRGVFITSLFTASFVSTALVAGGEAQGGLRARSNIIVCFAWAASALQFVHRCWNYHHEVLDAQRCCDREAFFSMCSFNTLNFKLPCTCLNQAFMLLIASQLHTAAGPDLLLALALSDFLCVFQLFLMRQRRFPAHLFLEGATLISSLPATAVLSAHGRLREALLLCGGLAAWLAAGRLRPTTSWGITRA